MPYYKPYKFKPLININAVRTSFEKVYPENYYYKGEMHNFWEMVFVADGLLNATADDRVYTLTSGNLIFHKPMEFHRLASAENSTPRVLITSFDAEGDFLQNFEKGLFKLNTVRFNEFVNLNRLCKKAIEIYKKEGETLSYCLAANKGEAAIKTFLINLYTGNFKKEYKTENRYAEIYKQIIDFLEDNICKNLTVDIIAKELNLSSSNLKRIFKMFCDKGIIEYFNSIKIRYAEKMLREGISIGEISEYLGFQSVSYFHVVFKKQMGITPKKYCLKNQE